MKLEKRIWVPVFLILLGACSTPEIKEPAPPGFLLEKAEKLEKPPVVTNRDIVDRLLRAESSHETLRQRFNILIDWIAPSES